MTEGVPQKGVSKVDQTLVPVGLFLFLGILFEIIIGVAIIVSNIAPRSFVAAQRLLYVSPVLFDGVQVSGVGFVVPALLALVSLAIRRPLLTPKNLTKGQLYNAMAVLASLSLASVAVHLWLPRGVLPGSVGGTDYFLTFSIVGFLAYLMWEGEWGLASSWALPLGFMLGVASDFESLRFIHGVVFGGNGIFDGDFLEPLSMFLGCEIARRTFEGPHS